MPFSRSSYPGVVEHPDLTEQSQLVAAFVSALPEYIVGRLRLIEVTADESIAAALQLSTNQLEQDLVDLLARPAADQTESPLEMVRRATEPISQALEELGVPPVERDDWEREAHPDDRYGLYPATSRDLGEQAWRLHIDWGKQKAKAIAGLVPAASGPRPAVAPSVVLFGVPMGDREELAEAIAGRGFRVLIWRNPAALADAAQERPALAVVHLGHPEVHKAIRELTSAGTRVVVAGDEVTDLVKPGLLALGAADVIPSSDLLARLDRLLPNIV